MMEMGEVVRYFLPISIKSSIEYYQQPSIA